jgi:hypothetical protein
MGSNYCCFQFRLPEIENEDDLVSNGNPLLMGRILNTTVLGGNDYITIFQGESLEVFKNVTSADADIYKPMYFSSPIVSVEIYKDRDFRSIYEILITLYHEGDSLQCKTKPMYRCSTNTSICISKSLKCDKFENCPNDSDESDECLEMVDENIDPINPYMIIVLIAIISTAFCSTTLGIFTLTLYESYEFKCSICFANLFGFRKNSKAIEILENEENAALVL